MKNRVYIKMPDLKVGYLYKINARNASFGIWTGMKNKSFIILRTKFSDRYLFEEYHYDTGPPFGTVSPHNELIDSGFREYDWEMVDKVGEGGKFVGYRNSKGIREFLFKY